MGKRDFEKKSTVIPQTSDFKSHLRAFHFGLILR